MLELKYGRYQPFRGIVLYGFLKRMVVAPVDFCAGNRCVSGILAVCYSAALYCVRPHPGYVSFGRYKAESVSVREGCAEVVIQAELHAVAPDAYYFSYRLSDPFGVIS